jgi:tetratricopeptide (TPR) repeat protein/TolB-like protein
MTVHRSRLSVIVWCCLLIAPLDGAAQSVQRMLVVPFDNISKEAQSYWLTEASAVILTDDLIALGAPAITREDRVRAFERLRVPAAATLSHATVIRLAELVGAGVAVVGSVEVKGQDLIVRARSIRIDVGRMAPEIVESGPLAEVFAVYGRVARKLAPASKVSAEDMEQGHPPIAAFEQYVKGLLAYAPASTISFLSQALRLEPSFHRARIELWNAYTDLSEHQQALGAVRDVPVTHRLARQARFLGAISMLHLAQYQPAFTALTDLQATRSDPAILNNLGIVQLRRTGSGPGSAVTYFRDATQADNTDSDLFFNLGYAYWLQKDLANAINWLRETVRRNPADDAAHYVLGVALQASGSSTEAVREKELARRLSSDYVEWEAKQGGRNEVPRGLERIKTDIDIPASLRVESAIVAVEQRDQRDLARFHFEAGRRAYQAERDSEATSALRRAVYLAPYDSAAHLLLGRVYLRSGRMDEAIDEFKIAIWSDDTVGAHLALADAYVQARDIAAARAELQWVLKADPQHAEAKRMLDRLPPL